MFADHFSELAKRYAAYRPHYPPAVGELLASVCRAHDVAWDVGCGSGQLSLALAEHFAHVIATDPAQAQLDHAARHPRVEYRCVAAEASGLDDASVELAVAAQAAHWFDWPRFVMEAGRVVRPGGVVALVTYRNAELDGTAGEALMRYYATIEPYWPDGRQHVNNSYRDLVMPWSTIDTPAIAMTQTWTRDELLGYATTWSATAKAIAARGETVLDQLRTELAEHWPDKGSRTVRWPLTIKLARR